MLTGQLGLYLLYYLPQLSALQGQSSSRLHAFARAALFAQNVFADLALLEIP